MPRAILPTGRGQHTNVAEYSLTGENPAQIVNLLLSENGSLSSRPGLKSFSTPTNGGNGLAGSTDDAIIGLAEYGDYLIAVRANRRIFRIDSSGTAIDISDVYLTGWEDPTFLEDDNGRLLIMGGGVPVQVTPTLLASNAVSTWAPSATHAGIVDRTLILNDKGADRMYYSPATDHTQFAATDGFIVGAGFFTAGTRSDSITAMTSYRNRLYCFGDASVESFYGTGDSEFPFRLDSNPIDSELAAPRSLVNAGGSLMWIDSERAIVRLAGRDTQEVSLPIKAQLLLLSKVSDCRAHSVEISGHHLVVFSFADAGVTLCWDRALDAWSEWRVWDTGTAAWGAMPMRAYAHHRRWGRHFCGGLSDGVVYELSDTTYQDNGGPLVRLWRGPFLTHGSAGEKASERLLITLDGGVAQSHTSGADDFDPVVELRYRDENFRWSNYREVKLGKIGELNKVRHVNRLGAYRQRQYELRCSDAVPFRIASIEEDFDAREI